MTIVESLNLHSVLRYSLSRLKEGNSAPRAVSSGIKRPETPKDVSILEADPAANVVNPVSLCLLPSRLLSSCSSSMEDSSRRFGVELPDMASSAN